jgi:hypothetical protein
MSVQQVSTMAELIQLIDSKTMLLEPHEYWLFRGQQDSGYQLIPSLHRLSGIGKSRVQEEVRRIESDLFFEFQARAHQLHTRTMGDWEYLFYMRHYGVPTRLLDWTECLGIALYFAVGISGPSPAAPCVWILDPWGLNEDNWRIRDLVAPRFLKGDGNLDYGDILGDPEEKFPWDGPIAIYPMQTNVRLAAQKGVFTVHGNMVGPLDVLAEKHVHRIDLSPSMVSEIRSLLNLFGIDRYSLFLDLDSLARTLSAAYGFSGSVEARQRGIV